MAPGHHIFVSKLSRVLGIHQNTLRYYLKKFHIDYQHTPISDSELNLLIQHFHSALPQSGLHYLTGLLHRHGLCIQRRCISAALHCVDPLGHVLRLCTATRQRQYQVSHPNALWHMDGHHKLVHWEIVIHGIVDGYCCTVCGQILLFLHMIIIFLGLARL